jgi:hypothetical protein
LATANLIAKKSLKQKLILVVTKAKTATPIVSKARKAPVKAKAPGKSLVKRMVIAPVKEVVLLGVVVMKRTSRTINLLLCYK